MKKTILISYKKQIKDMKKKKKAVSVLAIAGIIFFLLSPLWLYLVRQVALRVEKSNLAPVTWLEKDNRFSPIIFENNTYKAITKYSIDKCEGKNVGYAEFAIQDSPCDIYASVLKDFSKEDFLIVRTVNKVSYERSFVLYEREGLDAIPKEFCQTGDRKTGRIISYKQQDYELYGTAIEKRLEPGEMLGKAEEYWGTSDEKKEVDIPLSTVVLSNIQGIDEEDAIAGRDATVDVAQNGEVVYRIYVRKDADCIPERLTEISRNPKRYGSQN